MKKIIDITVELSERTILWEGDPGVKLQQVLDMRKGAEFNLTRLDISVHSGTHIDAPLHFIADGKSVDQIPMSTLVGPVQVVKIDDGVDLITAGVLQIANIHPDTSRLLLKTRNSIYRNGQYTDFQKGFCGVTSDGARYLIDRGIKIIGIDYLSISPMSDLEEPHKVLMQNNVVILETLDLSNVDPGFYDLYCLPLKLAGCEGAPVRAILVSEQST